VTVTVRGKDNPASIVKDTMKRDPVEFLKKKLHAGEPQRRVLLPKAKGVKRGNLYAEQDQIGEETLHELQRHEVAHLVLILG